MSLKQPEKIVYEYEVVLDPLDVLWYGGDDNLWEKGHDAMWEEHGHVDVQDTNIRGGVTDNGKVFYVITFYGTRGAHE